MARPKKAGGKVKRGKKDAKSCFALYLSYISTLLLVISLFLFGNLYNSGMITLISFEADSTIALSLLFPSIVFAYLLTKKHSMRDIISGLGLKTSSLRLRAVAIGIALFVSIFLLQAIFSVFQIVTHIPLPTNVSMALQGMPIYLLVFAAIIAPIDEEILFRGFLVPRIGIIPSALIFAAFHISYLSISEFIAAFIFGLLAGYAFKRTKSLYTTIIGHALVNIVTILVLML